MIESSDPQKLLDRSQPTSYTYTNNTAVVNFITGATLTAGGGALGANNAVATGYLGWSAEL